MYLFIFTTTLVLRNLSFAVVSNTVLYTISHPSFVIFPLLPVYILYNWETELFSLWYYLIILDLNFWSSNKKLPSSFPFKMYNLPLEIFFFINFVLCTSGKVSWGNQAYMSASAAHCGIRYWPLALLPLYVWALTKAQLSHISGSISLGITAGNWNRKICFISLFYCYVWQINKTIQF